MPRVSNWNPQKYDGELFSASMERLVLAAEIVAERARRKAPVGTIIRQAASGKYWMERAPGSLKRSIRVVRKTNDKSRNVRIYAGHKKVFYARMVEYGTSKTRAQPFLRPALNSSKGQIKSVLGGGT